MAAYHHAFTRSDYSKHFDMRSTEQFTSEQSIFHQHRDQNKLLIHIPALSPKSHHYPSLFLSTAAASTSTRKPLKMSTAMPETTSKTPLNAGLDNVLFVSTLDSYWTRTTPSYRMKRHTSNVGGTQTLDNANTLTTRRYSHPDTNKAPVSAKPMMECPPVPCSTSSSSSSSNRTSTHYDMRRLSFQSDAASTELIRRFSSESTTSSLSSISSFILESHSKLHQQYQQQQKVGEASSDAQTSHPVVVASEHSKSVEAAEAPTTAAAAAADIDTEPLDRDPGHACETMHSPSKEMQQIQGTPSIEQEEQPLPIWADPIKVKENPTRFQYTKSYLQQRDMLHDRSLPLIKPCVFHFSDTADSRSSSSTTTTRQNKRAEQYMSTMKTVFECGSVWEFAVRWRAFKEKCHKKPSQLTVNQNIFCFIHGVEPMWEDPVNKDGGRFFVTVYGNQHLDELFEWILCAFVGGNFVDDGVVGVAVSKRVRGDRIEFWFDKSADESKMPDFKNKLYDLLASTCHDVIKAGRYKKHFG